MAENRRDILSGLVTLFQSISEIKTVIRHYADDFDITQYSESDLPLLALREPAETPEDELTSLRALMNLELRLRLYFINWGYTPTSAYETLIKKIRDKAGSDFTVNNTAVAMWVRELSPVEGRLPLYWVELGLVCKYYLDQTAT